MIYGLVTVSYRRDRRGRTFRLLLPKQASHPKTISRLFVTHEGNAPSPMLSKSIVPLLYERAIIEEGVGLEPTTV